MHRRQANIDETLQFPGVALPASVLPALRWITAILIFLPGCEARAQVSGSVSLVSDYRFRGISLSSEKPEAQISLGYDSPAGWYAGAFASRIALTENSSDTQLISYGGYSHRLASDLSWEAGATRSILQDAGQYDYTEAYAGLASENFSGRLYFSPNYYGRDYRTVYAELNGSYQIREQIHLLAHIGFLRALSGESASLNNRNDARIGLSAGITDWHFQLAWVALEKKRERYSYSHYEEPKSHAFVLSASYSF